MAEFNVPEELEGLSEETIKEVLGDSVMSQEESGDGSVNAETATSDNTESGADEDLHEGESASVDSDDVKKEDKHNNADGAKTVPYAALADERRKRQERDKENERLKAELEAYRNAQQAIANGVLTNQNATQQAAEQNNTAQAAPKQTAEYRQKLFEQAKVLFVEEYGREPDQYNNEEDGVMFSLIVNDLHNKVVAETQAIRQREFEEKQRQALVVDAYHRYSEAELAKPDYQERWEFMIAEAKKLPMEEQVALDGALGRLNNKQGSHVDLALVRNFWNYNSRLFDDSKTATNGGNAADISASETTAQTQKKTKTVEEKINELDKLPRSNQIGGNSGASGGVPTVAELERMVKEMDWNDIPEQYKKMIMEG